MKQTFRVIRGDTRTLEMFLTEPYDENIVFDPTGWTLLFTLKEDADDADEAALIQKLSAVGGFTVTDAPGGVVDLQLLSTDFESIESGAKYVYDVQAENESTGEVKTVATGIIRTDPDVTKKTTLSVPTTVVNPTPSYVSAAEIAANAAAAQASADAAAASAAEAAAVAGGLSGVTIESEDESNVVVSIFDTLLQLPKTEALTDIDGVVGVIPRFVSLSASSVLAGIKNPPNGTVLGVILPSDSLQWWKIRAKGVGEENIDDAIVICTGAPSRCWARVG